MKYLQLYIQNITVIIIETGLTVGKAFARLQNADDSFASNHTRI